MKYWILSFHFFILSISSSYAQSPARTGTDYAVLFYISDFEKGWEALPDSGDEIDAIAQTLREDYGFQVDIVRNPDKAAIKKKIAEVNSRRYGADDQVLFFFSSHGHFDKAADRGYLIPADGQLPQNDPYGDTWISYDDLGSRITRNRSEHTLLLLDACYSGAFGDRWMGGPSELPWESEADCHEQAKSALNYDSRIYFTSGSRERRTPARSLFVSRFLRFLRSGTDKKILRTRDLRYELSTIEDPKPEGGTFTDRHEEYGDFVFVHKSACGSKSQTLDDQGHWLSIQSDFSKENLEKHMQLFSNCQHREVLQSMGIGTTGKTLIECNPSEAKIPNVFSPNGDGVNDTFTIVSSGTEEVLSMKIWNRWGTTVYEGTGPWDGLQDGEPASSGVYAYVIEVGCPALIEDAEEAIVQGDVTLVR